MSILILFTLYLYIYLYIFIYTLPVMYINVTLFNLKVINYYIDYNVPI